MSEIIITTTITTTMGAYLGGYADEEGNKARPLPPAHLAADADLSYCYGVTFGKNRPLSGSVAIVATRSSLLLSDVRTVIVWMRRS